MGSKFADKYTVVSVIIERDIKNYLEKYCFSDNTDLETVIKNYLSNLMNNQNNHLNPYFTQPPTTCCYQQPGYIPKYPTPFNSFSNPNKLSIGEYGLIEYPSFISDDLICFISYLTSNMSNSSILFYNQLSMLHGMFSVNKENAIHAFHEFEGNSRLKEHIQLYIKNICPTKEPDFIHILSIMFMVKLLTQLGYDHQKSIDRYVGFFVNKNSALNFTVNIPNIKDFISYYTEKDSFNLYSTMAKSKDLTDIYRYYLEHREKKN